QHVDRGRALPELDLAQHGAAHAGRLGQLLQRQPPLHPQLAQVRPDDRREVRRALLVRYLDLLRLLRLVLRRPRRLLRPGLLHAPMLAQVGDRTPAGEAGVELVEEADLLLAESPAEVDVAVPDARVPVDQARLDVLDLATTGVDFGDHALENVEQRAEGRALA